MQGRAAVTLSNENGPSRFSVGRYLHLSRYGRLKAAPGRPAAIPESTRTRTPPATGRPCLHLLT
jgi:hypothetical protein